MKTRISLLVIWLVCIVNCQRPPYVPLPVRYPDVSPRFRTPETEADDINLGNRNGIPDMTASTTTIRLPLDARGNADVVQQINSWPEDRKPFWYINAEAIENSRARPVPSPGMNIQLNTTSRSSFLPSP